MCLSRRKIRCLNWGRESKNWKCRFRIWAVSSHGITITLRALSRSGSQTMKQLSNKVYNPPSQKILLNALKLLKMANWSYQRNLKDTNVFAICVATASKTELWISVSTYLGSIKLRFNSSNLTWKNRNKFSQLQMSRTRVFLKNLFPNSKSSIRPKSMKCQKNSKLISSYRKKCRTRFTSTRPKS